MEIVDYIGKYENWIIGIAILFIFVMIGFIAISIISWKNGSDVKFLWFEIKNNKKENKMNENELSKMIINAKNVNAGTNYGSIGDTYTGIQQRCLTDVDKKILMDEFRDFTNKYGDRIDKSHITIGFSGDKESSIFASEIAQFMYAQGHDKIERCMLTTHGYNGRKFGVSNAPDNSVMIEIFQADNV